MPIARNRGPVVFIRSETGSIAAELALFLPIALLLLAALFDYGSSIFAALRLESAARAGAQYAMANASDTAGIQDAVLQAIGGNTSAVTVSSTAFCECPGSMTQVSCTTGTCTAGAALREFVAIDASESVAQLLPIPALTPVDHIDGRAVMRIR